VKSPIDFSIEFLVKNYQNNGVVSTKRLVIQAQERLEAILEEGTGRGGAVICHPHPLYGGSMSNGVVEAMERGFHRADFTTLKFNFRGVGGSTGQYGGGIGETTDVIAACAFLRGRMHEGDPFVLAGYSFGAWVSGMAVTGAGVGVDLFLVAYPFSAYQPGDLVLFGGRTSLVGGAYDEISPVDDLLSFYERLQCEKSIKIIPTSHFFEGYENDIADFVVLCYGERRV
jgi:uncharacterized protein